MAEIELNPPQFRQTCNTPIGWLTVVANAEALTEITLLDRPPAGYAQSSALTGEAIRQFDAYFRGYLKAFDLPYQLPAYSQPTQQVLATCASILGGIELRRAGRPLRHLSAAPIRGPGDGANQLLIWCLPSDHADTCWLLPGGDYVVLIPRSVVNHRIIQGQPGLFPDRPNL